MKTLTYEQFIKSLPENASIKLQNGDILTGASYLSILKTCCGIDPSTAHMLNCEFTIVFNIEGAK